MILCPGKGPGYLYIGWHLPFTVCSIFDVVTTAWLWLLHSPPRLPLLPQNPHDRTIPWSFSSIPFLRFSGIARILFTFTKNTGPVHAWSNAPPNVTGIAVCSFRIDPDRSDTFDQNSSNNFFPAIYP